MNTKTKLSMILIFLLLIEAFVLYQSTKKVAYIEYETYGENCQQPLDMSNQQNAIEQEFEIPYQLFYGISLRIANYGRQNNSTYEVIFQDKTENRLLATLQFNTSQAQDDQAYELFLSTPIKIDSTHKFSAIIQPQSPVNAENGVAFYCDQTQKTPNTGTLFYNKIQQNGNLCMNVYGGNTNSFYFRFTLICEIFITALAIYAGYLSTHKKFISTNPIIQAGLLGILVFFLLSTFAGIKTFSDEADNIIGGMLLEKGRILYVDYYTQHTPFAYWLCAAFSKLGAISVQQFRFLYNALIAIIFTALFLRHQATFGKLKMALIPIFQITFGVLLAPETTMILSDNIQAISMIVLFLEFLQYLKDKQLNWSRAIIVSLSIFCAFGSAFVSAYAIFVIGIGVLIQEIKEWKKQKFTFSNCVKRYWKLAIACSLPFFLTFVYLWMTHSLKNAYQQAFQFNREIYSFYLEDGFGANVFQPFFIGITNILQIIPRAILSILENTEVPLSLTQILITAILIAQLLKLIHQKEWLKAGSIFFLISFSFTRISEPFHEIAVWSLMLTANLILLSKEDVQKSAYKVSLTLTILLILSAYMNASTQAIFQPQKPISAFEKQVIQQTKEGEKIFFDIYSEPSVYLIYKNHTPMNRLTFILPWYLDWYEMELVQDLTNQRPHVILYDEEAKVWEISGYDDYLRKFLHENYSQTPENHKIWISQ